MDMNQRAARTVALATGQIERESRPGTKRPTGRPARGWTATEPCRACFARLFRNPASKLTEVWARSCMLISRGKELATVATSIKLDADAERRLDFVASQSGRNRELCLIEIVERGLDDLEDCYLAAEVLVRIRDGNEKVYSAADVRTALELGD